jgi:hypothetical protein
MRCEIVDQDTRTREKPPGRPRQQGPKITQHTP